jgi:UDP-hydrolysing UDP-N-acetyl-D-glucosamine 2-epimerase
MATAIAASYMNIPLAHTQGGDVTGSIDESVRHAITKLSHIHFPATEASLQRIVRMGEDPELIFNVGCPSIDLILDCDLKKDPQYIVDRPIGTGARLNTSEPFVMVLQHPVTTEYGDGIWQAEETLKAVHRLKMQAIVFWPNSDAGSEDVACGIRRFRELQKDLDLFRFFINLPPEDFILLMHHAKCLIGNSSSFVREGTFLGTPVVNIGSRQSGRERGENVVDVPVNKENIYQAIQSQLQHGRYPQNYLFGKGGSGKKISKILEECEVNIQKKINY